MCNERFDYSLYFAPPESVVRIQKADDFPCRRRKASICVCRLSQIISFDQVNARIVSFVLSDKLLAPVRRAIICDDYLQIVVFLGKDTVESITNEIRIVIGCDHYGDERVPSQRR
jgi:hypothetical protein